jgi:DNA-binding PadR family transcriptional regulator
MAVPVVRLLVLGVVRMHGRAHGYAVHRELRTWRVETWTRVRPASIYHALRQATKEGRLRVVGVEGSSPLGPGRTLYELTGEGEAEYRRLLEAALSSIDLTELGAGVAFMHTLPRARVVELLTDQHHRATRIGAGLRELMPGFPDRDQPPHTQDLLDLWSTAVAATAGWTGALLERLEAGQYVMADDASRGTT